VKDGLIQNPAACNFIPSRDLPLCDGKAPADACFTKAQIETISTVVSAVTDEHGNIVQPGYSISELQYSMRKPTEKDIAKLPATMRPMAGSGQGAMTSLADAVMKIFVHKNDPNYDLTSEIRFAEGGEGTITNFHIVAPQADVAKGKAEVNLGIGAHPEKIGALIKQNRKLIIWANLSDQLLTPYMSINYYKTLAKMYGGYAKLQENARLFLLPGTAHCSMSGCGPTTFDVLSAMEDWVENGKSPNTLIATQYATKHYSNPMMPTVLDYSKTVRTMPLCKFPEMAHYSGQGDMMDATNWSCPASDTSMLKVGESGRQAGVIE
jgi:feruloyl esterase